MVCKDGEKAVVGGVAADSGCGKSTFMRRARAHACRERRGKHSVLT